MNFGPSVTSKQLKRWSERVLRDCHINFYSFDHASTFFEKKIEKNTLKKVIKFLWKKMDKVKVNKIFQKKKSKNIKAIYLFSVTISV